MAGCKGVNPGDAAAIVPYVGQCGNPGDGGLVGQQLIVLPEQQGQDGGENTTTAMVSTSPLAHADGILDEREVYFLIIHFLADGPCKRAFGQLWNELLQHKLLPRRYHGRYSREGVPNPDENDDGLSFPLSYRDVASRHPNIASTHLVDLLQQLLINNSRPVAPLDSRSGTVSAADAPTLLGEGAFSLLDSELNKSRDSELRWSEHLRWPHLDANQVQGLMLRELGGGFARHHRAPSIRAPCFVIGKPSVFFDRISINKKLRGHRNAVYCAIFDRDGQHVITGSDDRLVKIWSMETGLCLRCCRGHEGDITDLAVSSGNELVASASNDFSIRVWRLWDGVPLSVLRGHGGAVTAIAFSPRQGCEHHLLSSSDDGTCRIWDARDSNVNSRVYMPDPKDPQTTTRGLSAPTPSLPAPGNQILCCAFNADGSIFVTGSSDKLARVWNATKWNDELTGRPNYELDTLQGHENDVNYVQFSGCAAPTRPSPEIKEDFQPRFKNTWTAHDSIVTCSRDGSAIIWTPRPRRHHAKAGRWVKAYHLKVPPPPVPTQSARPGGPRQRMLPTPRGVNMVVWSLDNRFVLAAIMDCRICVWNAVDGSLVHSLTGHDKQTYVLDVHPFNPRIAMSAGYDGRVIIWDIWDGCPIRVYETGEFYLVDGNFSPDGSSLVVSDEVGQIYLFSTGDGSSQKDAKFDQFFLGDFRPLVRDTQGNVLDQETQLPPHQRNIQDLLCDAAMIPYSDPYQTLYQQRRLGALGIDWHPPTIILQIGPFDDPTLAAPPDPPIPIQAVVPPSPDRRERRTSVPGADFRWVEQPLLEEGMDWDVETGGATEDSGSDYSASEESDDDIDKAETADEEDSDEGEEEEEDAEYNRCMSKGLRRSSRNKRKAEIVIYSSSGRRVKRKKYDDADTRASAKRALRRKKGKSKRRVGASTSRQPVRHHPEPSTRPKRQAAKNALSLFHTMNADDDDEMPPQPEKKVVDHGEKAPIHVEPHRVLRSRNKEEHDVSNALVVQVSKVESSDRGECSRRPRSQRKLIVKLRTSGPKGDLEDSKLDASEEPVTEVPVTGQGLRRSGTRGDSLRPRRLLVKYPRPSSGVKRNSAVIESSDDDEDDDEKGHEKDVHPRRLERMLDTDDEQEECEAAEQRSWHSVKGKGPKRPRGDEYAENHSDHSGSCEGSPFVDVGDELKDEIQRPRQVHIASDNLSKDMDSPQQVWQPEKSANGGENFKGNCSNGGATFQGNYSGGVGNCDIKLSSRVEVGKVATGLQNSVELDDEGHASGGQSHEGLENGNEYHVDKESEGECLYSPKRKHRGDKRESNSRSKENGTHETGQRGTGRENILPAVRSTPQLELEHHDHSTEEMVLAAERISNMGGECDTSSMDQDAQKSSSSEKCPSPDNDCGADLESSGKPASSPSSSEDGKDSLLSIDKQTSLPVGRGGLGDSDHEADMMNGDLRDSDNGTDHMADGDMGSGTGDEADESIEQSESELESREGHSQSELFEGNGISGRNWSESGGPETDDESIDEEKHSSRNKRQKTLGELQSYVRQESTSNRHQTSLDSIGKTRVRDMNSVLNESARETRSRTGRFGGSSMQPTERLQLSRKRVKDVRTSQISAGGHVPRTRQRCRIDGSFTGGDSEKTRVAQGAEQEVQEASVEFEKRRVVKVEKLEEGDYKHTSMKERRTSARRDGRRGQLLDRDKGKSLEENTGVYAKDSRVKKSRSKALDRKKKDLSWLLLTEVEPGTRYIPQFGDRVVYLRQGHQEFLQSTESEEKGPWSTFRIQLRSVEFCTITELEYAIIQSGHTCCKLTMKFTDKRSKVCGKIFRLTVPELTNFPDFIVERNRYDVAMRKGWGPRDKCQVWWRSDDEACGGRWWDGRVKVKQPKSLDFPESPWEQLQVQYRLDTNEPTRHSPWELFEPGNHWNDHPRISDDNKSLILEAIEQLESSDVGSKDSFGLQQLSQDLEDPDYLNCTPLPLDFETVRLRVEKDYYHTVAAYRHDVQLLVLNAESYYGPEDEVAAKVANLGDLLLQGIPDGEDSFSSAEDDSE